jgi:hypothetical protein
MKRGTKKFIKSADTDVSVQESMESIRALVRRHGAVGFGVLEDYKSGMSTVQFALIQDGRHVPISIPVNVKRVHELMYVRAPKHNDSVGVEGREQARLDQSERTTWRQLYLIIDATLTAHTLGVMPLSDSFLAHTMVVHDDGRSERMGDFVERSGGALAPGVRALLASGNGKVQ